MATTFSVVSTMALVARERIASAVSLGSTVWLECGDCRRAPQPPPSRLRRERLRESSRNCLLPSRGLVMISTAPYSSAFSVLCAPSSARLEQITTGIGCWLMIFLQEGQTIHARHLDIEGDHVRHLFADPVGRHKGIAGRADHFDFRIGLESTSLRVWRTTAESSTIRTRIFCGRS